MEYRNDIEAMEVSVSEDADRTLQDHDRILPMASSFWTGHRMTESFYRPKCSSLLPYSGLGSRSEVNNDDKVCSDEDNVSAGFRSDATNLLERLATMQVAQNPSHPKCRCMDRKCRFNRYFSRHIQSPQHRSFKVETTSPSHSISLPEERLTDLSDRILPPPRLPSLPETSGPELRRTHLELLEMAGGEERVVEVYRQLLRLVRCRPDLLKASPRDGNTLLMRLCCQPISSGGNEITLYGQIMAVIAALLRSSESEESCLRPPSLLFVRNAQEANAMELAALTNKAKIAKYLALLFTPYGLDANETNQQGHTVLHLLARKGDDCAETLEALLQLRTDGKRLFRLDVVNAGAKTPLDVAITCADLFAAEKLRYRQVISLFHKVIEEQLAELLDEEEEDNAKGTPRNLTYTNVF